MKILGIGDKESPYLWDHFDRERFGDIDLIISTGDLKADYLDFLVTMTNVPLLYVPGNHDGGYVSRGPEGCENIDGKLVTVSGLRILGFGGCQRYNNGPYQYTESEMKRKILRMKPKLWRAGGFDILVAHSPAYALGDGKDQCHVGFRSFNELIDKYSPKYFLHGHQHISYSGQQRIIKYHDTNIINTEGYYLFDF